MRASFILEDGEVFSKACRRMAIRKGSLPGVILHDDLTDIYNELEGRDRKLA